MITMQTAKKQKGFTLIEVLIVIALASGMLFAIFTLAGRIGDRSAIKEMSENVNMLAAETQSKFRPQGNYSGVSATALVQMGVVPHTMINGNNIRDMWNQSVDVAPAVAVTGAPPNSAARFRFPAVPSTVCADLVESLQGTFARVDVAGVTVKNMAASPPVPLNPALVASSCNATVAAGRQVDFFMAR